MLQQTQVETALPYFHRWMRLFPDIRSLAESSEQEALKAWQGLGYYSRVRNLRESAKKIMTQFSGVFPRNFEDILSLKGVGRYSAGAIASIAFNETRPIVDGNVLRVLSRTHAIKRPIDDLKHREYFWKLQESLIPEGRARDFNQALMELGALVCLPKDPRCGVCPVRSFCAAAKKDQAHLYPVRSKKRKIVKVHAASLVVSHKNRFFIHRRPVGKVMGGLWEFPEWKLSSDRMISPRQIENKLCLLAAETFGKMLTKPAVIGKIRRSYTHHQETLWVFRSRSKTNALSPVPKWPRAWAGIDDLKSYPFSSAHAKIAALLAE